MRKDEFGDRMKAYESVEAQRELDQSLPTIVRIDGKKFSKFTKSFKKPYDQRITDMMRITCKALVAEFHPEIGFVQSDEITLIFAPSEGMTTPLFRGRTQKLTSILASAATAEFAKAMNNYGLFNFPRFDARAWNVPSKMEAANSLLWRSQDARRNGISCAYRWSVGKQMHGMNQADMRAGMSAHGIDFDRDFTTHERFGTYYQRVTHDVLLTDEEIEVIPERHRPETPSVKRSFVVHRECGYLGDMNAQERVDFVFGYDYA